MPENTPQNNNLNDFFEGNHLYVYLYKKSEKLASAVYMVTNLIPEEEILRGLLREKSINIFSGIMQLQKKSLTNGKSVGGYGMEFVSLDSILSYITEAVSMLQIANISGYISEMNFSILKREYTDLGMLIKNKREDIASENIKLPHNFFDVPNLYETYALKQGKTKNTKENNLKFIKNNTTKQLKTDEFNKNIKKTSSVKDTYYNRHNNNTKEKKNNIYLNTAKILHNSRRNTILELLQNKQFITVKDIADAVDGCSSKTLQRELLSLVNEGILRKDGERRWSKYSLA